MTERNSRSPCQVVKAMLEEDVERLCGPRYCHQRGPGAFRWGGTTAEVTLGSRRVGIDHPKEFYSFKKFQNFFKKSLDFLTLLYYNQLTSRHQFQQWMGQSPITSSFITLDP